MLPQAFSEAAKKNVGCLRGRTSYRKKCEVPLNQVRQMSSLQGFFTFCVVKNAFFFRKNVTKRALQIHMTHQDPTNLGPKWSIPRTVLHQKAFRIFPVQKEQPIVLFFGMKIIKQDTIILLKLTFIQVDDKNAFLVKSQENVKKKDNTNHINKDLINRKIGILCQQFSLHYLFETAESVDNVIHIHNTVIILILVKMIE